MILSMAYIPVEEVPAIFQQLENDIPEKWSKESSFSSLSSGQWNQHDAAITGAQKTNIKVCPHHTMRQNATQHGFAM